MDTLPAVICGECAAPMELRTSRYGKFWGCTQYPSCSGAHGAHPDGRPMGVPANAATKHARIRAHQAFDKLWRSKGWTRLQGYQWMQHALLMTPAQAHIGNFSEQQCEDLIREVATFQG